MQFFATIKRGSGIDKKWRSGRRKAITFLGLDFQFAENAYVAAIPDGVSVEEIMKHHQMVVSLAGVTDATADPGAGVDDDTVTDDQAAPKKRGRKKAEETQ